MSNMPVQRSYSLDHALALAQYCAHECNIDLNVSTVRNSKQFYTYLCMSNNHHTQLSFRGAGSGVTDEAKVKAIYESLEENLLYQVLSQVDSNKIRHFSVDSCPTLDKLKKHKLLPRFMINNEHKITDYPWLKLTRLNSVSDNLDYPLGLLFPHIVNTKHNSNVIHASVSELANSTGIAIGATWQEAIIHGMNDWVERDAYGLFLLSTVIKNRQQAKFIVKNSLPQSIRDAVREIENEHSDELIIVDITSDFGIPAFLVSFTRQSVPVQPSGLGASLCKDDAIQQALFEALQARDRYNRNTVIARNKTLSYYQQQPILLQAFRCDLTSLKRDGYYKKVDWVDVASHAIDHDLDEQIHLMVELLETRGCSVYSDTIFQHENGLTLVYVLVAGAETFGMMREGMYLPIKERGMEIIS